MFQKIDPNSHKTKAPSSRTPAKAYGSASKTPFTAYAKKARTKPSPSVAAGFGATTMSSTRITTMMTINALTFFNLDE